MKEYMCREISYETLVAYSDGKLLSTDAEKIAVHIAQCNNCRTMLSALQRSLQLTLVIWQNNEARWPKKHSFKKPFFSRWLVRRVAAVAASILLIFGIGVMRRSLYKTNEEMFLKRPEPTAAEIEFEVQRAAVAAQMLSVADMLADQPGGEEYAVKRYNYIINSFAGRDESDKARSRLKNLLERTVKQ